MSDADRLQFDVLTRQLERMRAMQYAYHRKFFTLLLISTLVAAFCLAFPSRFTLAFVCFGLVTTGVSAAFLLHFCDFARTHARALETRLNQLMGERVLIASELESEYFYPHEQPRFQPILAWPTRFFDFYTLHFCAAWGLMTAYALWRLFVGLTPGVFLMFLFGWMTWASINGLYVMIWFRGAAERRMAKTLRTAYGSGD